MKYLFIVSLVALTACAAHRPARRLAALDDDLKGLDKNKKTVCTVTLNSDEEKEVFQSRLKGFNFIELAQQGPSGDWLKAACEKKVQCDVLLVSGHFGGTFFGKSGLRLPLPKLEELSCSNACPGIFERPKEVFLMGCNTLAGKTRDRRTPEEYVGVLMADGFTRQQAEQVAAARYSMIGSSNAQRMRMAFPGQATKLYGFDSVGPSGKSVEELLRRYLASVPDYDAYLDDWNPKAANDRLAAALKITSFTQAPPSPPQTNNPACVLGSPDRPVAQKLAWINQVLNDPAYAIAYVPNIAQYFSTLRETYGNNWPAEERAQLRAIQQNQPAKERMLKLLEKPLPGILSQQAEILTFARTIGWVDDESYARVAKSLLGGIFQRNLTLEQKDSVCAADMHLNIGVRDLPAERWNENTIAAIACLQTKDLAVAAKLIGDLQKPGVPEQLRLLAISALGSLGPLRAEVQQKLVDMVNGNDESFREAALRALADSGPTLEAAHRKLIALTQSEDQLLLGIALDGLRNSRSMSLKNQRTLLGFLRNPESPSDLYDVIGPNVLSSPVVQQEFFRMLKQGTPQSRQAAMWTLWSAGWKITPELKRQLAENVGDPAEDVNGSASLYFMQEDQEDLSDDVERILRKWIASGTRDAKQQAISLFGGKGVTPRPETQREILKRLGDADAGVRVSAVRAVGGFCAANPDAATALTAAQSDRDDDVRRAAEAALKRCTAP